MIFSKSLRALTVIFLCATLFICTSIVSAEQAPNVEWEKSFSDNSLIVNLWKEKNGNFVTIGKETQSHQFEIITLDQSGNLNTELTMQIEGLLKLNAFTPTIDDGFLLSAMISNPYRKNHLIKLSKDGDIMWEKVLDIQLEYYNGVLTETKDGGCLFGVTVPSTSGHKDIYIAKLTDHGSIIWEKRIENKELEDLIETSDGGNVITGTFHRDDQEGRINRDLYLAKLDATGETTWELNYENGQDTQASSVIETSDHDFIVSGSNGAIDYFPYQYPYLVKFDQEGKKVWEKKDFDIGIGNLSRINQTDDGHYLLTGYANYRYINMGIQYSDEYLLKMDDDGNKLWEQTLAVNEGQRVGSAIQQLSDKSILALGKDYLNGPYYLTRLQAEEGDDTEVVSLSIDSKSLRLQAGEIKQLTLTAVYTDRQPADVTQKATWSSTDEKIVSVDEKGNVNARKKGKAHIIAKYQGKNVEVAVKVK